MTEQTSAAILTIDLEAIAANYRLLRERVAAGGGACAAVVKADAYGLGAKQVAPVLAEAGCETFFVALIDEGIALRQTFNELGIEAAIHVLGGLLPGTEGDFTEYRLVPVLNSIEEIGAWKAHCDSAGQRLPADLHIDTGMCRLGLPPGDVEILVEGPQLLDGLPIDTLISHLACADEPDHPLNEVQRDALLMARHKLALADGVKASLANSSGIFLGTDFHFDVARPGCSLYGVNPQPGTPNPMAQVVHLQGKILQSRIVDRPQTVGYGATHQVNRRGRIATVGVGYADGYLRSLSGSGSVYIGDIWVPVVGRVSMDLITLDVTDVAEEQSRPGCLVDLIGPNNPVDRLADEAGTIGYEILTSLGHRYHRVYSGTT